MSEKLLLINLTVYYYCHYFVAVVVVVIVVELASVKQLPSEFTSESAIKPFISIADMFYQKLLRQKMVHIDVTRGTVQSKYTNCLVMSLESFTDTSQ